MSHCIHTLTVVLPDWIGECVAGRDPKRSADEHDVTHASVLCRDADEALIGDAGAVAVVIDASLGTCRDYNVRMELQGQHTRGMTVLDPRRWEPVGRAWVWQTG